MLLFCFDSASCVRISDTVVTFKRAFLIIIIISIIIITITTNYSVLDAFSLEFSDFPLAEYHRISTDVLTGGLALAYRQMVSSRLANSNNSRPLITASPVPRSARLSLYSSMRRPGKRDYITVTGMAARQVHGPGGGVAQQSNGVADGDEFHDR